MKKEIIIAGFGGQGVLSMGLPYRRYRQSPRNGSSEDFQYDSCRWAAQSRPDGQDRECDAGTEKIVTRTSPQTSACQRRSNESRYADYRKRELIILLFYHKKDYRSERGSGSLFLLCNDLITVTPSCVNFNIRIFPLPPLKCSCNNGNLYLTLYRISK